ncbi:hypothetical protein FOZ61_008181 [Perkinsus olseni]|uniref:Uncharacterized protein n=1 Tax=Perkinsus olseni TaxID=32597 RepID=A0A7J6L5S9_PEROL|nr:hypothetical protein FOZ61_008181 [Perkinsus olseni]
MELARPEPAAGSQCLRMEIHFDGVRSDWATRSDAPPINASSTIHDGAVGVDLAGEGALAVLRIHLEKLHPEVRYVAVLCRTPNGGALSEGAKSMNYYVGYEGVEEDPLLTVEDVPFDENDVDWFVIGVLIVDRDAGGGVVAVHARNVCSFPQGSGKVDSQLQELMDDTRDDVARSAHTSNTGDYTTMPAPVLRPSQHLAGPNAAPGPVSGAAETGQPRQEGSVVPSWDDVGIRLPEKCARTATPMVRSSSRFLDDNGTSDTGEADSPMAALTSMQTVPALPLRALTTPPMGDGKPSGGDDSQLPQQQHLQWDEPSSPSSSESPSGSEAESEEVASVQEPYAQLLVDSRKSLRHIEAPKLNQRAEVEDDDDDDDQQPDTVRLSKAYTTLKPSGRRVETRSVTSPASKGNWPAVPILPAQTSFRPPSEDIDRDASGGGSMAASTSSPGPVSNPANVDSQARDSIGLRQGGRPDAVGGTDKAGEVSMVSKLRTTIAARDEEIAMLRQQLRQEGRLRAELYKQRDTAEEDQRTIEQFLEDHRQLVRAKAALHIAWFYARRKQRKMKTDMMMNRWPPAGARPLGTDEPARTPPARPSPAGLLSHHLRENHQLQTEVENLREELGRRSRAVEMIRSTSASSCPQCPTLLQRLAELEEQVNEINKTAGAQLSQDLNLSPPGPRVEPSHGSTQRAVSSRGIASRPVRVSTKGAKPVEQSGSPVTLITPKLLEQKESIAHLHRQYAWGAGELSESAAAAVLSPAVRKTSGAVAKLKAWWQPSSTHGPVVMKLHTVSLAAVEGDELRCYSRR